jgi:hypothetical protein
MKWCSDSEEDNETTKTRKKTNTHKRRERRERQHQISQRTAERTCEGCIHKWEAIRGAQLNANPDEGRETTSESAQSLVCNDDNPNPQDQTEWKIHLSGDEDNNPDTATVGGEDNNPDTDIVGGEDNDPDTDTVGGEGNTLAVGAEAGVDFHATLSEH